MEDTWANTAEDTLLLDALLRTYPATLVISLGGNDAFLLAEHAEEVRSAIFRDLARVHEQQPDLPVVVAPPSTGRPVSRSASHPSSGGSARRATSTATSSRTPS